MDWKNLQDLCKRHGWFTEGTNEQFLKLKNVFEYCVYYHKDIGCLAWLIWLCSDMRGEKMAIQKWTEAIKDTILAVNSVNAAEEELKKLEAENEQQ